MWKFLDRIKDDIDQDIDKLKSDESSRDQKKTVEQEAFALGEKAIEGCNVVALQDETVEMINQDQQQIEIYFDNGWGCGIKMPFGPTPYTVEVTSGQAVKKGQTLVHFNEDLKHAVHVYVLSPKMIETLSDARFRIDSL